MPLTQDSLRMVTFNIRYGSADDEQNHWDHRKEILFECIRHMQPEVLGVQECLPFQADEIKNHFPGLDRFGLGRFHNTRTKRNHEDYSGEHCMVFYDFNRLALQSTGTFWLSDTPDTPGSRSWGNSLPRIATWGILLHRESGRRLMVCNTHFDNGGNIEFGANSTRLIQSRIKNVAGSMPVVLMGDFNLPPESEPHRTFSGGLIDAWRAMEKSEENAGTSHGFSGSPQKRIDWILVSPEIQVLSVDKIAYNKEGYFPSDHFPLLAVLGFK